MSSSMSGGKGMRGGLPGEIVPRGYRRGQTQNFTPEMMEIFKQQMQLAGPNSQLYKQAMGDDEGFADFENYANRQFQEFSGQNASRFSAGGGGAGAMSARRGSGFQNSQTQGAQDFASQLSMQRQNLQRQALMDLKGLSESILSQKPYENFLIEKQHKPSRWSKIAGFALPAAGAIIGGISGGPAGAAIGGQIGSAAGSGFR